jgi:catechol 2,3-dioxygenase-like lactoylglutathione lyase family enzyme
MATPSSRSDARRATHGIDHVTIGARDYGAAKRFYELALRPLGFAVVLDWPDGGRVCLALAGEASSLWVVRESDPGRAAVSLAAPDRSAVDSFHAAALAAGGRTVSPPGPRPEYTARTYAAEVLDPDANRIEAVCRYASPLATEALHAA